MAYIMDLEEDQTEDADGNPTSDIPTTTIRSKADVQTNLAHQQAVSMSANDIVINKLTQVRVFYGFSYGFKEIQLSAPIFRSCLTSELLVREGRRRKRTS